MHTNLDTLIDQNFQTHLQKLQDWIAIPSISTLPEHKADVEKSGHWLTHQLKDLGFPTVEFIQTEGHPLVYAEWLPHKNQPTVLGYGHFDVQPATPLEEWETEPFVGTIKNNNIYARGANDNKGQSMALLGALHALITAHHGTPPINIKLIFEGAEELGSPDLCHYVANNALKLAADAALVVDTDMYSPQNPCICTSLRGMVYAELTVTGAKTDLHSGMYGGVAPNPLHAISVLINKLKGEDNTINIPNLMENTPTPTQEEQEFFAKDPVNYTASLKEEMGIEELNIENGISPFAATGLRPTLEVHGIMGGYTGPGAKTVIPAQASVKLSLRLPPAIKADDAWQWLQDAIQHNLPKGYKHTIQHHGLGNGIHVPWDHPYMQPAKEAIKSVYKKQPVPAASGGSIPCCAAFAQYLDVPVIMLGFGLPDDNLHAPNEKYSLDQLKNGMKTLARYLDSLAK